MDLDWIPFKIGWGDAAAWAAAIATVWAVRVALGSQSHADEFQQREQKFELEREAAARARLAEAMSVALHGELHKIVSNLESMRLARHVSIVSSSTFAVFKESRYMLESPLLDRLPDWIHSFEPPLSGNLAKVLGETYSMRSLLDYPFDGLGEERFDESLKVVWNKADRAVETIYDTLEMLRPLAERAGCELMPTSEIRALGVQKDAVIAEAARAQVEALRAQRDAAK